MKMVKISNEKCLKDKNEKVLKSSNDLKKVWSDRYDDKQSCSFVLNVIEKEEEKETEEDSDNEKRVKKKKTKGNTEEEDSKSEDNNKKTNKSKRKKSESENRGTNDDDSNNEDKSKKVSGSDSDSDRSTRNEGASKKRKRKKEKERYSESESEDNIDTYQKKNKKEPVDPEWDRIFPMDETKDLEPLALTNSNEVEQIAMIGSLKVKKAIECIQVHSRLAVFKDDFKYKDQVDSEIKTHCLNLQQATVGIFKAYGTIQTNFLIAQKIIQWKPLEIESVEAKVFWEGVICACNEVVTQLMNIIRLEAGLQHALAGVRFGIVDFVERCSYGESVSFAIQGLNIQFNKFKDFQNKTEKEVEKSIRQAFGNGGSKEAEEISKQLLYILEKLKKAKEKKKEFRKKEEETSQKIEEIMKKIGEKQADKRSCEIELSIAKNDVAAKKKQQENNKSIICLNNEIDTLNKQKYDLIKRTNEEMKEIEKEIDDIIQEKEKLQDNLFDILKKTGLRSADAAKAFFQMYDKFLQGLLVNYAGFVNIAKNINALEQWLSPELKLDTFLRSFDLGVLTQPLQKKVAILIKIFVVVCKPLMVLTHLILTRWKIY
ncbi:hypothetical protein RFI_33905, partial [Reticulomyxa filosa]